MLIRKGALLSEALVSLLLATMTTWLIVTTMQYFNRIQVAEEARMKEDVDNIMRNKNDG
ncbi:hypothetical protein [Weissella confusa]|uniref:hypothetical protein n=1 Tax=Weissella confusa TaxID=1583 RepID=UPI00223B50BC|nr:hypothetical protein [Weissella confusa]